jgi:hypothetical protein
MISFRNDINEALSYFDVSIKQAMDEGGVNASGRTSRSLKVDTGGLFGGIRGVLLGSNVFHKIESGTPPGSQVTFFAIRAWGISKGIFSGGDENRGASRITSSIRRKGTKTWQRGGRTDIITEPLNDSEIIDTFAQNVAETAIDAILKTFK